MQKKKWRNRHRYASLDNLKGTSLCFSLWTQSTTNVNPTWGHTVLLPLPPLLLAPILPGSKYPRASSKNLGGKYLSRERSGQQTQNKTAKNGNNWTKLERKPTQIVNESTRILKNPQRSSVAINQRRAALENLAESSTGRQNRTNVSKCLRESIRIRVINAENLQ